MEKRKEKKGGGETGEGKFEKGRGRRGDGVLVAACHFA